MSLHCIVWCCMVLYCWLWRAGCISQDTYLLYDSHDDDDWKMLLTIMVTKVSLSWNSDIWSAARALPPGRTLPSAHKHSVRPPQPTNYTQKREGACKVHIPSNYDNRDHVDDDNDHQWWSFTLLPSLMIIILMIPLLMIINQPHDTDDFDDQYYDG